METLESRKKVQRLIDRYKIPFSISGKRFLGGGSEGLVFQEDDMALKITFKQFYEWRGRDIEKIIAYFKSHPSEHVVWVEEFGSSGDIYWIRMERLFRLDGSDVRNWKIWVDSYPAKPTVNDPNVERGRFVSWICNQRKRFEYQDLKPSNVMKDRKGVWKLIDLEGVELK